jgi:hypothetical protein
MRSSERDALCRELAEALAGPPSSYGPPDPLASITGALAPLQSAEPAVGQLWRAARTGGDQQALVALTHVSGALRAVLATEDSWIASTEDVVVSASDSPTGCALALAAWSDTPLPRSSLRALIGCLPESVIEPLLMLLQRQLTGGFRLRAVESLSGADGAGIRWLISASDGGRACSFASGSRILDQTDGRVAVRAAMRGAAAWLADDAVAEVLERGQAPEPEPWHARMVAKFRAAVEALGDAVVGDAGARSVAGISGAASTGAALASLSGAGSAAGGGLFGQILVGSLNNLASSVGTFWRADGLQMRHPGAKVGNAPFSFTIPVGAAEVAVWLEFGLNLVDVLVKASADGKPRRGVRVVLKVSDAALTVSRSASTDKHGIATLRDVAVPSGAGVEVMLTDKGVYRSVAAC